MPDRRAELLEATIDHVHRHGLADLSLRPLATAIGTSARLLIYHFGSKERLVAEALEGVRRQQERRVEEWLAEGGSFREVVDRFWAASTSPEADAYGRFFFEASGLALVDDARLPGFLDGAVRGWLDAIASALSDAGVPADRAETTATAVLASHRGLLLDLLATGDRERVDSAHGLAMDAFEAQVPV